MDGTYDALHQLIERGRRALDACDWAEAETAFDRARGIDDGPDVLDGLGQALYWQADYPRALELRERAYAGYLQRGDRRAAATVAIQLAQLHGLIYGNPAAVSGWVAHAQRALEDCDECETHGAVELFLGCITSRPRERERRARAAAGIARRFGAPGLEYDALGYVAKARIEIGDVVEGMRLLDEAVAAVASGLVRDAWAAGSIYCSLFHGCEMAIDVARAEQWLASVDHYVERTRERPISAICRMHYGGLLTMAGRWGDAERELRTALDIYRDTYRGTRFEAALRLADLRARQGRLDEADELMFGFEDLGLAARPRARALLARGEPEHALAVLDRHVSVDDCDLPTAPTTALAVEAGVACGAISDALDRVRALEKLAVTCGAPSVRGLASRARARVDAVTGEGDPVAGLDAALVAFAEAGLAYDLAATQLELARQVSATQPGLARGEARRALEGFRQVGAPGEADEAARLLDALRDDGRPAGDADGVLTPRQREVLALLGEGRSNAQIAERLFISPRTAEHHVSAILGALGLQSRTEAAAYAARRAAGSAAAQHEDL